MAPPRDESEDLPLHSPPETAGANPCRCKDVWISEDCPGVHHGCPDVACDGAEFQPWCIVDNPGCDEEIPSEWFYCGDEHDNGLNIAEHEIPETSPPSAEDPVSLDAPAPPAPAKPEDPVPVEAAAPMALDGDLDPMHEVETPHDEAEPMHVEEENATDESEVLTGLGEEEEIPMTSFQEESEIHTAPSEESEVPMPLDEESDDDAQNEEEEIPMTSFEDESETPTGPGEEVEDPMPLEDESEIHTGPSDGFEAPMPLEDEAEDVVQNEEEEIPMTSFEDESAAPTPMPLEDESQNPMQVGEEPDAPTLVEDESDHPMHGSETPTLSTESAEFEVPTGSTESVEVEVPTLSTESEFEEQDNEKSDAQDMESDTQDSQIEASAPPEVEASPGPRKKSGALRAAIKSLKKFFKSGPSDKAPASVAQVVNTRAQINSDTDKVAAPPTPETEEVAAPPPPNTAEAKAPRTPKHARLVNLEALAPAGRPTCGGWQAHGTPEGAPCQFPFRYGGMLHNECITTDHDRPWCLTDPVEYQEKWQGDNTASWGNCDCKPGPNPCKCKSMVSKNGGLGGTCGEKNVSWCIVDRGCDEEVFASGLGDSWAFCEDLSDPVSHAPHTLAEYLAFNHMKHERNQS